MKTVIYEDIHKLSQARSLVELRLLFESILGNYGFDQFAVQYTPLENKKYDGKPYALATFKTEWVNYYIDEGFHTLDPVVVVGTAKRTPFLWSRLWEGITMSGRQKQFFNEASEYGVGAGVGLPVPLIQNEPGMVSLVSSYYKPDEIAKILDTYHIELMLLATHFQHMVMKFVEEQESPYAPHLTAREKECLTWAAIGKTDGEIGTILSISPRTVNNHMASSYQKLGCVSREQAVLKAVILRIIAI